MTPEIPNPRWRTLAWSIAAAGILLRVVQYAWNRSWWVDESMVVLNIVRRSAGQLVGPLDLAQAAPPLFLLIERLAVVAMGTSEYALRLFPLLCSIGAVAMITAAAIRWIGGPGAALAAGMAAFSDMLIWHGVEAKPYSSDVLLAAIVWWIAMPADAEQSPSLRRWLAWCGVSAVLLWASYPLIFVVVGIVLVRLFFLAGRHRADVRCLAARGAAAVVPAVSFVLVWYVAIRHQQQGNLYAYWDEGFADWSRPWMVPLWALIGLNSIFNYVIRDMGTPLLALGIVGVIAHWKTRRVQVWLLIAPILLAMAAGAVGEYPFPGKRLTVFLTPAVCWLAGLGLAALLAWVARRWPKQLLPQAVAAAVGIVPLLVALSIVLPQAIDPPHRGQVRPVARQLLADHRDEPVAVLGEVRPFQLYALAAGRWQDLEDSVAASFDTPDTDTESAVDLIDQARRAADGGRYWIVFEYARDRVRRNYLTAIESAAPGAQPRLDIDGAMLLEVSPAP